MIIDDDDLSLFLAIGTGFPAAIVGRVKKKGDARDYRASNSREKDHLDAACEASRCIANTMLLFEDGRSTFISEEAKGGQVCLKMLNEATTSDEIFILSRILFFTTVSQSPFIIWLIEESHDGRTITDIIEGKLDPALSRHLKNNKANLAQEAFVDLLKSVFNLLLYYPKMVDCVPQSSSLPSLSSNEAKIMGDFWSPKLDGFLPPILELYRLPLTTHP